MYLIYVKVSCDSEWIYYGMVTADRLSSEISRLNNKYYAVKCEAEV